MIRICQIQKTISLLTDIDERTIDRRKDGLDLALVDVTQTGLIAIKLNIKIIEPFVVNDSNATLAVSNVN